jgi:hypothetical protein
LGVHSNESNKGWLEPVLRRELNRVPAPPELWDRVVSTGVVKATRRQSGRSFVWMLAVASAVTASVFAVAWGYNPVHAGSIDRNRGIEFRSNQVSDVRNWIRDRTGLEIPLIGSSDGLVEMRGAAISKEGAVEVHYRCGEQSAVLVVTASSGSRPDHGYVSHVALEQSTTVSWSMGSREYTLSVERPGGLQAACLACHAELTL